MPFTVYFEGAFPLSVSEESNNKRPAKVYLFKDESFYRIQEEEEREVEVKSGDEWSMPHWCEPVQKLRSRMLAEADKLERVTQTADIRYHLPHNAQEQ